MDDYPKLSGRELQALKCVMDEGLTCYGDAARFLDVSLGSFKWYIGGALRKIGASNLAHAAFICLTSGWWFDREFISVTLAKAPLPRKYRVVDTPQERAAMARQKQRAWEKDCRLERTVYRRGLRQYNRERKKRNEQILAEMEDRPVLRTHPEPDWDGDYRGQPITYSGCP